MKANHPEALKALHEMASGVAVIYIEGDNEPRPLGWAGEHRGGAVFFTGDEPHVIPSDYEARVGPVAVAYYDGRRLAFYVTPVTEAPEVKNGAVADAVEKLRETLEAAGGVAQILASQK